MKLLFDNNLSPRLVHSLSDIYPNSEHVRSLQLERAPDQVIWEYAARQGFTITSKDADFHQRSFVYGPPPRVIWIQRGNCSTTAIVELLRGHSPDVKSFLADTQSAFLAIR